MYNSAKKKNYYLLRTLKEQIRKNDVISFDIFDTLILRNVLFPEDIFKILAKDVFVKYNIKDFNYIRKNVEEEVRKHSNQEDITIRDIYNEIKNRCNQVDINYLINRECDLEIESCCENPLIKELYNYAQLSKKKILFITDMYLDKGSIEKILKKCGYYEYSELYVSGEVKKAKFSGSLFKYIKDELSIDEKKWIHIGDNIHSDVYIPQSLGITAAYYRCPRDWFFMQRDKEHRKKEEELNTILQVEVLDDSIEYSQKIAREINNLYTQKYVQLERKIISVNNVSMMFNMSAEKVDNIKEYVIKFLKKELHFQEFWALKNISFDVYSGEKIGLVGLNGSGKSTMLKIVSGVLSPTNGKVNVDGIIAPLIELGAGFDIELSAKENIYLNGAILGYSNKEMDEYYDYILDFSELRKFEHVAIKNFSSGMTARLGFAIATCHKPDILIIDEILSVGDFEFQKKCHRRMEELTEGGTTVLFVSHSAQDIINMCDRAIWLDHGELVEEGEAQFIVEKYLTKK